MEVHLDDFEMSDSETELLLNPITKHSSTSGGGSTRSSSGRRVGTTAQNAETVYRNRRKQSSRTMCGAVKRIFG